MSDKWPICDAAFRLDGTSVRCDREALHADKDDVGHAIGSWPRLVVFPRRADPPASPEEVRRLADLARKNLIHVQQQRTSDKPEESA
jgi:hypothetical protein